MTEIEHATRVTVGGKEVAVPTESGTRPIAQGVDDGQQVIICATGFLPAKLFSAPHVPVTWTNLTNESQQVVLDFVAVKSALIAPGGSFSWTPTSAQSVAYHSVSGLNGVDVVAPSSP